MRFFLSRAHVLPIQNINRPVKNAAVDTIKPENEVLNE